MIQPTTLLSSTTSTLVLAPIATGDLPAFDLSLAVLPTATLPPMQPLAAPGNALPLLLAGPPSLAEAHREPALLGLGARAIPAALLPSENATATDKPPIPAMTMPLRATVLDPADGAAPALASATLAGASPTAPRLAPDPFSALTVHASVTERTARSLPARAQAPDRDDPARPDGVAFEPAPTGDPVADVSVLAPTPTPIVDIARPAQRSVQRSARGRQTDAVPMPSTLAETPLAGGEKPDPAPTARPAPSPAAPVAPPAEAEPDHAVASPPSGTLVSAGPLLPTPDPVPTPPLPVVAPPTTPVALPADTQPALESSPSLTASVPAAPAPTRAPAAATDIDPVALPDRSSGPIVPDAAPPRSARPGQDTPMRDRAERTRPIDSRAEPPLSDQSAPLSDAKNDAVVTEARPSASHDPDGKADEQPVTSLPAPAPPIEVDLRPVAAPSVSAPVPAEPDRVSSPTRGVDRPEATIAPAIGAARAQSVEPPVLRPSTQLTGEKAERATAQTAGAPAEAIASSTPSPEHPVPVAAAPAHGTAIAAVAASLGGDRPAASMDRSTPLTAAPASPIAAASPVEVASLPQRLAGDATTTVPASPTTVTPPAPLLPPTPEATSVTTPVGSRSGDLPARIADLSPRIPLPQSQAPLVIAGTTAPAFRLFAAAIHAARTDEADRAASPTAVVAPLEQPRPTLTVVGADGAPLDMTDHRWPHAMVERINRLQEQASATRDAANTSIRLVPDALGTIDVSVRRDGDTVRVHLNAEQVQTRTLIADAQPRLQELAEAKGVRLVPSTGGANVGAGSDGQAQRQPAPRSPTRSAPAPAAHDESHIAITDRVA